jgi:uncharacterized repeat protein (TIGR01451 family)
MIYVASPTEIKWISNDGYGNLGNEFSIFSGTQAAAVKHIATGDFDGDGAIDIAMARSIGSGSEILMIRSIMDAGTTVNGFVYLDQNENGIYDGEDIPAFSIPVGVQNSDALTYSLPNGTYFLSGLGAGNVIVKPMINDTEWTVSSTPAEYEIELNEGNNYSASDIDFGIVPLIDLDSLSLAITMGNLRCNEPFVHWITITNHGTTTLESQLVVNIAPETPFLNSVPEANNVTGTLAQITIPAIIPFASFTAEITLQGPDESLTGEILQFQAEISAEGLVLESKNYSAVVNCAYDPNDKLESNGWTEEGFILPGTALEYTIRFQNTGNDVAMNVRLEDQLSNQLLLGSFEAISWSHTPLIQLSNQGKLTVSFNDIMLPDSGANWIESQGFFKFRIMPMPTLSVGDVINNTAEIFFDFNAPVVTNTTINTLYSCTGLAAFTSSSLNACEGTIFDFESTMPHIENYSWMVNGEASGSENGLTLDELTPGAYIVMLTTQNPLCSEQNEVTINVYPLPEPQIEAEMATLMVAGTYTSYQWYLNGLPITDMATASTYTVLENGTYTVVVTDENDCEGTSEPYQFNSLNLQYAGDGREILIYPIPTSDKITIDFGADTQEFTSLQVLDALGHQCIAQPINSSITQCDLRSLSNGLYTLILVKDNGTVYRNKVLVAR